jgi:hypothetical protein
MRGRIIIVTIIHDTIDGWIMSARWPAHRRLRFRLALLLYAVELRRLAVRVAGVLNPPAPCSEFS